MDSSPAVLSVLFVVVVVVMVSRVALPVIAQMLATTMGLIFIGVVLATEMPVSPARPDPTRYLNFLTPILLGEESSCVPELGRDGSAFETTIIDS